MGWINKLILFLNKYIWFISFSCYSCRSGQSNIRHILIPSRAMWRNENWTFNAYLTNIIFSQNYSKWLQMIVNAINATFYVHLIRYCTQILKPCKIDVSGFFIMWRNENFWWLFSKVFLLCCLTVFIYILYDEPWHFVQNKLTSLGKLWPCH